MTAVFWSVQQIQKLRFEIEELRYLTRDISRETKNSRDISRDIEELPRSIAPRDQISYGQFAELSERILHFNYKLESQISYISEKIDKSFSVPEFNQPSSDYIEASIKKSVQQTLARDINHALKTPLSRLDTTSALLDASVLDPFEASERITNATQICYYYLDSFRSLSVDVSPGNDTDHLDFSLSATNAIKLYIADSEKDLGYQIDLPHTVDAIADYYAIAALMPLIENAVDASPNLSDVVINGSQENGVLEIQIQNFYDGNPPQDFEKRGVTTKPQSSNEGLGIAIVRSFLEPLSVGSLTFDLDRDEKRFKAIVRMKAK